MSRRYSSVSEPTQGQNKRTSLIFLDAFLTMKANDDSHSVYSYRLSDNPRKKKSKVLGRWLNILEKNPSGLSLKEKIVDFTYECSILETRVFICVLEDAADKIKILDGVGTEERSCSAENRKTPHGEEKFAARRFIYDRDTLQTKEQSMKRYQLCKLQGDRRFLEVTLKETMLDLDLTRGFTSLMKGLREFEMSIKETQKIFQEQRDFHGLLIAQNAILRIEEYVGRSSHAANNRKMDLLRRSLHDSCVLNSVRERTVTRFEAARREQNQMKLRQMERELEESTRRNRRSMALDKRVDAEIIEHLARQTDDYKSQISEWSECYDVDVESYDTMLLVKKEQLESLQKELEALRRVFYERELELEDYLNVKHGKEMLAKRIRMVGTLQSWWRGVAHRKKLMQPTRRKAKAKKAKKKK